ncbi:transcription termination factor Rho [Allocatelliglobosispora scoriae]|uniref:Transcription termination factor Rho n=1 Tax=Allocatelliglobosispora scoriae TaxID=643052 RepID=A0A841BYM3_9ACTN|nr:transcription termination factor Rho [Allocatelliglobosispora scoriae]MBB5872023.1 transcription termination factor Rho [Allocatelliglobosispora scoriae]
MSDTTDISSDVSNVADDASAGTGRRKRSGSGLSAMLLPELQSLAGSLGISGTARMRKGELIAAIVEHQSGGAPRPRAEVAAATSGGREEVRAEVREVAPPAAAPESTPERKAAPETPAATERPAPTDRPFEGDRQPAREEEDTTNDRPTTTRRATRAGGPPEPRGDGDGHSRESRRERRERSGDRPERTGDRPERGERTGDRAERAPAERGQDRNTADRGGERTDRGSSAPAGDGDFDDDDSRRGRRSRFRDRRRGRNEREGGETTSSSPREPQVTEDEVLIPVAGIVDVLENYAFVRTSGYLSGPNDVYVAMSQVKKYGLRRGDAITGAVRTAREGGDGRRDKYNPLVRLDTVNGMELDEARRRPEFYKLTPLYPQDRLRLETEPNILTTRVIDLVMPIGKGQRALIVSPPKAGKTMVLQAIANAITTNNPECHLMVVLVDERPEEVTDMQRSVKGEVIASTFDRPPMDHTTVAELAIERAKRLVELGHDVVVLLDSITRLGRAYNLAAPASGRILSGGIDSTALYPPKRFLGAARNIENGGSLTIIATALVETGSMMDTVIFEEFKGTGNAELKLDRKIADKRIFPAIDVDPSGTRKEEILLAPEELAIVHKLRKVLHSLESQAALDLLLGKLKETRTNIEFLMQIAKTTPND